jgi:hypothetical protein
MNIADSVVAEPAWHRTAWTWAVVSLTLAALVLILAGCVGPVNDYAVQSRARASEATSNTIKGWQEQDDNEARALAASYCGLMRSGAVYRRYRDPEVLKHRDQLCGEEAQIGFIGP